MTVANRECLTFRWVTFANNAMLFGKYVSYSQQRNARAGATNNPGNAGRYDSISALLGTRSNGTMRDIFLKYVTCREPSLWLVHITGNDSFILYNKICTSAARLLG